MQTQLHDMRRLTRNTLFLLCPDSTVGSPDPGPLRALKIASYHETESHALTRAIACIFMPLAQLRVMEVISFALTPSGPPICSMATYKSFLDFIRPLQKAGLASSPGQGLSRWMLIIASTV